MIKQALPLYLQKLHLQIGKFQQFHKEQRQTFESQNISANWKINSGLVEFLHHTRKYTSAQVQNCDFLGGKTTWSLDEKRSKIFEQFVDLNTHKHSLWRMFGKTFNDRGFVRCKEVLFLNLLIVKRLSENRPCRGGSCAKPQLITELAARAWWFYCT